MQRPSFSFELLPRDSAECLLQSLNVQISVTGPVAYYQLKYLYQVSAAGEVSLALNLPEEAALCEMGASQEERSVSLSTQRSQDAQQLQKEAHPYTTKRERRLAFHVEASDDLLEVSFAFATFVSLQNDEALLELPYVEASQALQFSMRVSLDDLPVDGVQPAQVTMQRGEGGVTLHSEDPSVLLNAGVLRLRLSPQAPLVISLPQKGAVYCVLPPVKEAEVLPRQLTILLDCSGSMAGSRFESSRRMLRILCSSLWPHDIFSVRAFGAKPAETPLWAFDDESLGALDEFLTALTPRGSKELSAVVEGALSLPVKGGYLHTILLVTDNNQDSDHRLMQLIKTASDERGLRLHVMGVGDISNEASLRGLAWAGKGSALFAATPKKIDTLALRFHRQCTPIATQLRLEGKEERLKDMYLDHSYSFWTQSQGETLQLIGPTFSKTIKAPDSKGDNIALRALWAKARIEELAHNKEQHKEELTQLGLEHLSETPFTSWIKERGGSQLQLVKKVNKAEALYMPMLSRSRAIFFGKTPVYHLNSIAQRLPTVTERLDAPKEVPVAAKKHQRERFEQAPDLAEFAPLQAPEPLKEFPKFSLRSTVARFTLMRTHFSSRFSLQDRAEMALFFLIRAQRRDGSFSGDISVNALLGEVLSLVAKTDDKGVYQQPLRRLQAFLKQSPEKAEVIPYLLSKGQLLDAQKLIGENRGGVLELGDPITMTAFLVREIYKG